jgi:protein SCO1/2
MLKYLTDMGADDGRWHFLAGSQAYMRRISMDGFKLGAEPGVRGPSDEIMHSNKLVLVDPHGHIRGYFDGTLSSSVEEIQKAVEQLNEEARR